MSTLVTRDGAQIHGNSAHGRTQTHIGSMRISSPSCGVDSRRTALGTALIAAILCSLGCDEPPPPPAPLEVAVARPVVRELVDWDEFTGQVEAVERIEVRARVNGYLESTHFREGEIVEQGRLLFVIDPRPYQAELDRAEAELARARARLALARNDAKRAERLVRIQAISQEEFDTRTTEHSEAGAELRAAEATVEQRRLDLEFTRVRAPIQGRVGRSLVDIGNLISGGTPQSTMLTTVVSLDPVHVYFEADERSYLKYTRLARSGERPSSRDVPNPVRVAVADEQDFPHPGYMDFVDNEIDPNTGTLRARAVLPNPDGLLTPGLFARVRLLGSGRYRAFLIPDEVIGTDQAERTVLVVGADDTLELRTVETGPRVAGLRIVRKGLEATDRVVISGLQRVRPGVRVTPRLMELATPERIAELEAFMAGRPAPDKAPAVGASPVAVPEAAEELEPSS